MGDPRKHRKKYKGPSHPWQAARMEEEKEVKGEFGLKNKKEIWKVASELRRITSQAKKLVREKDKGNPQAFKEEKQLLDRLMKFGLAQNDAKLEGVLGLTLKDFLKRRLQSVVIKLGLAITSKQARQFIVHGHIFVDGKRVSVPSYFVNQEEEFKITFDPISSLNSEEHPERIKKTSALKAAEKAKKAEEEARAKETEEGITEEELEKIDKEVGGEVIVES